MMAFLNCEFSKTAHMTLRTAGKMFTSPLQAVLPAVWPAAQRAGGQEAGHVWLRGPGVCARRKEQDPRQQLCRSLHVLVLLGETPGLISTNNR